MVPKLYKPGKSFKKLAAYLLSDPGKAKTAERVAWTHTLNLASDHHHPALAVDEMLWTFRSAEALKQLAGAGKGGARLESPVKHFSLSWHPSQRSSQEQMIETVESFLKHMSWHKHQALLVCHADKDHQHVHVMLNRVHPETGRALIESFEKRWAQKWAKEFELEQGLVFCEQRLRPAAERDGAATRENWQRFREDERQVDRENAQRQTPPLEFFERGGKDASNDREWKLLFEFQKQQRLAGVHENKQRFKEARNQVFKEIRLEFSHEWKAYFKEKKAGLNRESLDRRKAEILARQNKALESRRADLTSTLKTERDQVHKALLESQAKQRRTLKERQHQGLSSFELLDKAYQRAASVLQASGAPDGSAVRSAFRDAAVEIGTKTSVRIRNDVYQRDERPASHGRSTAEKPKTGVRNGVDSVSMLGMGALGALATIGERLFDGFFGDVQPQKESLRTPKGEEHEEERERDALHAVEAQKDREATMSEADRLYAQWQERRGRQRQRD